MHFSLEHRTRHTSGALATSIAHLSQNNANGMSVAFTHDAGAPNFRFARYQEVFFVSILTRRTTPERDEATRPWFGYLGFQKPGLGVPVFVEEQHPP
jgi:hypothetical protein